MIHFTKGVQIVYLCAFFFSLFLTLPKVAYDPIIDFYRLKKQYSWLTPEIYYSLYQENLRYDNVSIDLGCALIQSESGDYCRNNVYCMKNVVSYAGAHGLMQIMPVHHKGARSDLFNTQLNIYYGMGYLSKCITLARGDKREALRFYNAGPASSRKKYKNWWYVNAILKNKLISLLIPNEYLFIY